MQQIIKKTMTMDEALEMARQSAEHEWGKDGVFERSKGLLNFQHYWTLRREIKYTEARPGICQTVEKVSSLIFHTRYLMEFCEVKFRINAKWAAGKAQKYIMERTLHAEFLDNLIERYEQMLREEGQHAKEANATGGDNDVGDKANVGEVDD